MNSILQQHRRRQQRERIIGHVIFAVLVALVMILTDAPTWAWLGVALLALNQ